MKFTLNQQVRVTVGVFKGLTGQIVQSFETPEKYLVKFDLDHGPSTIHWYPNELERLVSNPN